MFSLEMSMEETAIRVITQDPKPIAPVVPFYKTEEYCSLWLGLGIFAIMIGFSYAPMVLVLNFWSNGFQDFSDYAILWICFCLVIVSLGVIHKIMNKSFPIVQYVLLHLILIGSQMIGSNPILHAYGMGASVWCMLFGCLLVNIFPCSVEWISKCLSLEFFIKTGIVLLAIDAFQFAIIGPKALLLAWLETGIILCFLFLLAHYCFGWSRSIAIVGASGVSICGSSAVMAISEIVKIPKETKSMFIAIMSLCTIPQIPLLPLLNVCNDICIGAWLGGSVDSTAAVIASASLHSDSALESAVIVKMLQNILIGPISLIITMLWTQSFRPLILWDKFPKFIFGFLIVALISSFVHNPDVQTNSFFMSEWFSGLSFIQIGADIRFREMRNYFQEFKKWLAFYLIAQSLDLCTTLGIAYLIFELW